ncbi:hypothetical protein Tco_0868892 [Tanacetum coccineum]
MIAGQRKPDNKWTGDKRKAANLDQRLKSLIMYVLPDDQMNFVINCLTTKSTWDDLILYHEVPFDVKESRVMDLKLCYNTFKFKEGKSLTQTFTRYKALINELVNDGIKLSNLEINTGFINGLPKKWLSFCQSLRNTNNEKDSELASLFGKLKYEENLIDNSPDDEEDTRSSHEYLNDLKEEYQVRALLAKSKRFFKKVYTYQSPFQPKPLSSPQHKPELRPTKDFEAKYNKVKAKLALLGSSASAFKASMVKNKGARNGESVKISMRKVHTLLEMKDNDDRKHVNTEILKENKNLRSELKELKAITETWLNSSNKVNQCISEQIPSQKKRIQPWLSEAEGFILPNHDTGRILPAESQRNTIDPSVAFTDSSATDYDLADESSVCSTPLPPLKKLEGVGPITGPKTIKSILKSKFTLKTEALKGVIINNPSSAPAKGNKSSSALKVHSAHAGKLNSVKSKMILP